MKMFIFSVLDWKYLFGGNLFQKIKIGEAEIQNLAEFEYVELNGDFYCFIF